MKAYRLIYSRESLADLKELRSYLGRRFSVSNAREYIARLKGFCANLSVSPYRGENRPELRPRFRSVGFEKRVSIVFTISDKAEIVRILNFNYGGFRLRDVDNDQ